MRSEIFWTVDNRCVVRSVGHRPAGRYMFTQVTTIEREDYVSLSPRSRRQLLGSTLASHRVLLRAQFGVSGPVLT